jgi:AbrB family looped-hinge helix DNA binding protein
MSKITSKLQVTLPKVLANRFHIKPGDEIDWQEAGDTIRVFPRRIQSQLLSTEVRLHQFDEATQRQRRRQKRARPAKKAGSRGWTREEIYKRGRVD